MVTADGKGLVGHAGAVLLRKLADRIGLTRGLAGVLPTGTAAVWRERAAVLVQLAVTIALGSRSLLESEQLQLHHQGLFGPAVSDSTTRRVLAGLDEQVLTRIAKVRRRVRRHVWMLLRLRPGGFPRLTVAGRALTGWIGVDLDATVITSMSRKEGAAGTFKGTFGFHPWAAGARTPARASRCNCARATREQTPSMTTCAYWPPACSRSLTPHSPSC